MLSAKIWDASLWEREMRIKAEMGMNGRKYIIDHYSLDKVAQEEIEVLINK